MKIIKLITVIGSLLSLVLFSCETDNDTTRNDYKFSLEFSDGTIITENDIYFYDSTTHFLFLRNDLNINQDVNGYNVLVNSDTIYSGILHSCFLSSPPPETFFISDCYQYGQNVISLGYYPYSEDLRNNPKIINAFKEGDILRSGLKCEIDTVQVNNLENSTEVMCKVTVTNQDVWSYYILHPDSMGDLDFNCYTGGLSFKNIDTKVNSFLRWSVPNPDYENLIMNDFSLLPGKSAISFIFKSSDYYKMENGYYNVTFRYCGLAYNVDQYDLVQHNGWIWVGTLISEYDSLKIE